MLLKSHYKVEISYKVKTYGEESMEAIIENINKVLEKYPVKNTNWSLILSDPQKYQDNLQTLVLQFYQELNMVIIKKSKLSFG